MFLFVVDELPDGQVLDLGSELYEAPELLFNPALLVGHVRILPKQCFYVEFSFF